MTLRDALHADVSARGWNVIIRGQYTEEILRFYNANQTIARAIKRVYPHIRAWLDDEYPGRDIPRGDYVTEGCLNLARRGLPRKV